MPMDRHPVKMQKREEEMCNDLGSITKYWCGNSNSNSNGNIRHQRHQSISKENENENEFMALFLTGDKLSALPL